jgi:hypothetical protein
MVTVADANAKVVLALGFIAVGFVLKALGLVKHRDGEGLLCALHPVATVSTLLASAMMDTPGADVWTRGALLSIQPAHLQLHAAMVSAALIRSVDATTAWLASTPGFACG